MLPHGNMRGGRPFLDSCRLDIVLQNRQGSELSIVHMFDSPLEVFGFTRGDLDEGVLDVPLGGTRSYAVVRRL